MNSAVDRSFAVAEFWSAPDQALFSQEVIALVTDRSQAAFERARWAGFGGPDFIKLGRSVRYRKADVLRWINGCPGTKAGAG